MTGLERLYYDRKAPYSKQIRFYNKYLPKNAVDVPKYYVVSRHAKGVIERLNANEVKMRVLTRDSVIRVTQQRVINCEARSKPYENHHLYGKVEVQYETASVTFKAGDIVVPTKQSSRNFLNSVLLAEAEDSYFRWNFMDSHLDQKEYFSPYVF